MQRIKNISIVALLLAVGAVALFPAVLEYLPHHHAAAQQTHAEAADAHAEAADAHAEEANAEPGGAEEHAHEEAGVIALTPEMREAIGLTTAAAALRPLSAELKLPGEVRLNEDTLAHVAARLGGVLSSVRARVGDKVAAGDVLAVIESRELADAKGEYLAAAARTELAEKTFAREKGLRDKGISAEKDYLEAQSALAETRIVLHTASQKLQSLGVAQGTIEGKGGDALTRLEITAPCSGEIIEKHATPGEMIEADRDLFTLADMSSVWVDARASQSDLPRISAGQSVTVHAPSEIPPAPGTIAYISPIVDNETRTVAVRTVLPNESGVWRPGLYVTIYIAYGDGEPVLLVPKNAVQRMGEKSVVFIEDEDGIEQRPVMTGRESGEEIEIIEGLAAGETYIVTGAFELKAKLVTGGMGSHAGHGH